MKKSLISILVVALIACASPVQASTKATTVMAAFKTLLNSSNNSLKSLEQKLLADTEDADGAMNELLIAAENEYQSNVKEVTSLQTQIAKSQEIIRATIPQFNASNEVEFLTSNYTFTGWRFWFDCASLAPNCGEDSKQYSFKIGDRVKMRPAEIENLFPITYVEELVKKGAVRLLKPVEFQSAAAVLKKEILEVSEKSLKLEPLQKAAKSKYDKAITDAKSEHERRIEELQVDYDFERERLDPQRLASELAISAAKRASNERINFEMAFAVAVIFDYNRKRLKEVANSDWTGEWTNKSIDSRAKVLKLILKSDSISEKYDRKTANSFNMEVGGAFTIRPDFKAVQVALMTHYRKTTKTTLRF